MNIPQQIGSGKPEAISNTTRQVYNLERIYQQIGEQHDLILADLNLPLLDPSSKLQADWIARLALVTAFQFAEALCDSAAAEAVSTRKDWKYALHLSMNYPEITARSLCKFRANMRFSAQALNELKKLLESLNNLGLYPRVNREGLEPDEVITTMCWITCHCNFKQAMKMAMVNLAIHHPDWLAVNALPHWYERYKKGRIKQSDHVTPQNVRNEIERVGSDMRYLIAALNERGLPELTRQPEIQNIAQILEKAGFFTTDEKTGWRLPACSICVCSAHGAN